MKSQSLTKAHAHFLGNYVIVVISLTIGPTSALRCTNLRLRTSPGARAPRALFLAVNSSRVRLDTDTERRERARSYFTFRLDSTALDSL